MKFVLNYEEGADHPRFMTVAIHPRLIDRPGRIGALERLLDYVLSHDEVWICRRNDVARHWYEHHAYAG